MANISFTIPDDKLDEILDAFCIQEGYDEMILIDDVLVPNPESKLLFTRKTLKKILKSAYVRRKGELARDAAVEITDSEV